MRGFRSIFQSLRGDEIALGLVFSTPLVVLVSYSSTMSMLSAMGSVMPMGWGYAMVSYSWAALPLYVAIYRETSFREILKYSGFVYLSYGLFIAFLFIVRPESEVFSTLNVLFLFSGFALLGYLPLLAVTSLYSFGKYVSGRIRD